MILADLNIGDKIQSALEDFLTIMIDGIPVLIVGIVLFILGYLIAKVVSIVLEKTFKKLKVDDLAIKLKLDEPMRVIGVKNGLSSLIATVVFWLIMLVVIVSTTRNLGIQSLTEQVERIIDFIPNMVSAVLILLFGYFIAAKIKGVMINMTRSLGSNAGSVLGNILYYFIMIMVVITAVDQLGVKTDLISKNILIIVAVILIAGAIAYGHAARGIMKNMLSSFYSRKNFYEGQKIRIGELSGTILEIDKISVTIKTDDSKVIIPSSQLLENKVEVLND